MNEPPIEGKWYWVWERDDDQPYIAERQLNGWRNVYDDYYPDASIWIIQWEPIPPPTMGAPKGKEEGR